MLHRRHRRITHSLISNIYVYKSMEMLRYIAISVFLLINLRLTYADHSTYSSHEQGQQGHHTNGHDRNRIGTEEQCKQYLCKYGYLNCNCTSYMLPMNARPKRAIGPLVPTELEQRNPYEPDQHATFPPPRLTIASNQACRLAHFKQGYEEFQLIYRLNVTGHCDGVTKSFMSRRRCGQPDIFDREEIESYRHERSHHPRHGEDSSETSDESGSGESNYRRQRTRRSVSLIELIAPPTVARKDRGSVREEQLRDLIAQQSDNHQTYNQGQSTRTKRSFNFVVADPIGKLNKAVATWRLMSAHTNPSIPIAVQNSILSQAFRYWSEIAPLCFREDKHSSRVDIEVGFVEGTHLNCYKQFDGVGGEIAHKFYRDVHFDKTDPYSASLNPPRSTDISLRLVAVHEIGHVLGLNHSAVQSSVMNAIYHRNLRGQFELSGHDRSEINKMYGSCGGRFDIVMDYVTNSGNTRVFNTFFFRGGSFWMYENKNKRTRYGDPKIISSNNWQGLPTHLDTFVHYFVPARNGRNGIAERYFFFKGSNYYQYDPSSARVSQTGSIRQLFRSGQNRAIPNNLDAAFYEYNTRLIFFFKGNTVYKYNYRLSGAHSCCTERPKRIVEVFRPATNADLTSPTGVSYARDLDAVYFSWTSPQHLYLIKGEEAWRVHGYSVRGPYLESRLRVRYVGKWNTIWNYICETDC